MVNDWPFGKEAYTAILSPDLGGGVIWGATKIITAATRNLPKQNASEFQVKNYFALDRCLVISSND